MTDFAQDLAGVSFLLMVAVACAAASIVIVVVLFDELRNHFRKNKDKEDK
jgi:hypothetical protein